MDGIQPVGAMIQPPPPNQGLNAYSTLLGIQQQQLGIQQQGQALQGQQAQVAQEKQRNQELQSLQQFSMRAAHDPAYHNADGSLNVQKFQTDAMARAPTYGGAYVGQMTSNANGAIENRKALLSLSNEQRQTIGNYLGAVAAKPNATKEDLVNAVEQARTVSDDPLYQKSLTRMLMSMPPVDQMPTDQASAAIRQTARMGAMATGAPSAAASNPQMETYQAPNNILGLRQTNPQSPLGMGSMGGTVAGLAPSQQPGYLAQAGAAQTLGGGGATMDVQRAGEVAGKAQNASATVQLSKQVDALAAGINSGEISKLFAKGANYMGFSSVAQMRTQLQKDLGQLRGAVASRAGSDARASEILEGYPTDTTPEQTIHAAMDYIRGGARQDLARANQLQQFQKRPGPEGLAGFQAADTGLVSRTNPLMHEYMALSPQERAGFYRRNFKTPQEAQQFKDSVKAAGGQ